MNAQAHTVYMRLVINVLLSNVASVQRSPIAWCCKCWVTQLPGIHACGTPPGTTLTEMQ